MLHIIVKTNLKCKVSSRFRNKISWTTPQSLPFYQLFIVDKRNFWKSKTQDDFMLLFFNFTSYCSCLQSDWNLSARQSGLLLANGFWNSYSCSEAKHRPPRKTRNKRKILFFFNTKIMFIINVNLECRLTVSATTASLDVHVWQSRIDWW